MRRLIEKKTPLPLFVFATAFDNYAVRAFEVNALDYLLKPIAKPRLVKAIERIRRFLDSNESTQEKLDCLVRLVQEAPSSPRPKLMVKAPVTCS